MCVQREGSSFEVVIHSNSTKKSPFLKKTKPLRKEPQTNHSPLAEIILSNTSLLFFKCSSLARSLLRSRSSSTFFLVPHRRIIICSRRWFSQCKYFSAILSYRRTSCFFVMTEIRWFSRWRRREQEDRMWSQGLEYLFFSLLCNRVSTSMVATPSKSPRTRTRGGGGVQQIQNNNTYLCHQRLCKPFLANLDRNSVTLLPSLLNAHDCCEFLLDTGLLPPGNTGECGDGEGDKGGKAEHGDAALLSAVVVVVVEESPAGRPPRLSYASSLLLLLTIIVVVVVPSTACPFSFPGFLLQGNSNTDTASTNRCCCCCCCC